MEPYDSESTTFLQANTQGEGDSRSVSNTSKFTVYEKSTEAPLPVYVTQPLERVSPSIKSPRDLRNGRIKRLICFLVLELSWLNLGLIIRFVVRPTSSGLHGGTNETAAAFLWDSYLSSFGIWWQTIAALPMADLVREIYSGEWWRIHTGRNSIDSGIDRVSTLTSSRYTQFKHALFREFRATLSFRLGFIIGLLLTALHSIAPPAISVGHYTFTTTEQLAVGRLRPNLTQVQSEINGGVNPFATQSAQIAQTKASELAQKVVRFEYVSQVENSMLDFDILPYRHSQNHVLFGIPPRNISSRFSATLDKIVYQSDAVTYDFSCQWLAPALRKPSPVTWSFGDDMEAVIDLQAVVSTVTVPSTFGIYPLEITSTKGSNGSFAWFIFGLTDQTDKRLTNKTDLGIFIDLSTLLAAQKNVDETDWVGVITGEPYTFMSNVSTTASILFCDPNMKLGSASVFVADGGFTLGAYNFRQVQPDEDRSNLDPTETKRMLGQSLNGIPWDSVVVTAQNQPSKLSKLSVSLLFEPSLDNADNSTFSTFTPLDLSDISANLNRYTLIAGKGAYLDGSEGTINVTATFYDDVAAIAISWTHWIASLAIVAAITTLVLVITIRDFRKGEELVPFVLDAIQQIFPELMRNV